MARLTGATAENVVNHMKSIFARNGIPEQVMSDNCPQFTAAVYAKFAKDYNFEILTSSPLFPQANGEVERAVETVKTLLKKSSEPYLAQNNPSSPRVFSVRTPDVSKASNYSPNGEKREETPANRSRRCCTKGRSS